MLIQSKNLKIDLMYFLSSVWWKYLQYGNNRVFETLTVKTKGAFIKLMNIMTITTLPTHDQCA